VPDRLPDRRKALVACAVAVCVALVPLSAVAASAKPTGGHYVTLIGWLRGHGLRYGLAGYWQASAVSLESGNQVQVRTVLVKGREITPQYWETNTLWYDPARYYANFVLATTNGKGLPASYERVFGRPASTYRAGNVEVMIYHKNLLRQVQHGKIPSVS
jgi:hypothetical protein